MASRAGRQYDDIRPTDQTVADLRQLCGLCPACWVVVWQLLDRRDYLLDASAPTASGEAEQRQPHRPVPAVAASAHLPIFHGTRVTHVTPPTIQASWRQRLLVRATFATA